MTVTFVDGLVVARSTYNTDINYRSVVIIGQATEVKDLDEKRHGLDLMVDHIIPGRSRDARPPDREGAAQHHAAAAARSDESSAKVRTGWPLDEEEDYDLPIWAGVIPFATVIEPAEVDPGSARRRRRCRTTSARLPAPGRSSRGAVGSRRRATDHVRRRRPPPP